MLLDIDGTIAPIVEFAADATVPEVTRQLLIAISRRYGLLACISGRRASDARAMVSIGTINYIGSHGAELLEAGATKSVLDPRIADWAARVAEFRQGADTMELRRTRVRIEDKGSIVAFHWRGVADPEAARAALDALADQARGAGFEVHWGRMVMEVRPPVRIDKGAGIKNLLTDRGLENVMYVGDDVTDLDAFRAVREMVASGTIGQGLCVGVRSDDGPPEITQEADLVVDGTDGVRGLLVALAADPE